MSIHKTIEKIKTLFSKDVIKDILTIFIFIVGCLVSFWAGRVSVKDINSKPVIISGGIMQNTSKNSLNSNDNFEYATNSDENRDSQNGEFVASKRGKKYYPINCSGAQSIKESNRIYFNSQQQAEEKGYTKSSQCEYN